MDSKFNHFWHHLWWVRAVLKLKINLVVFLSGNKNSLPSFFYFSLMMPAKICRICRNMSCWASFCFYSLDLFWKSNLSNYDCLLFSFQITMFFIVVYWNLKNFEWFIKKKIIRLFSNFCLLFFSKFLFKKCYVYKEKYSYFFLNLYKKK